MSGRALVRALVVSATGTVTMALQVSVVRLVAPAVGASIVVWAVTICCSLCAMSVGYAAGGELVGRCGARATAVLAWLLATSAAYVWVVSARGAAAAAATGAGVSLGFGAFVGWLVAALIPATALATSLPIIVDDMRRSGAEEARAVGRIYAVSTVGSIIGTLVAGLALLEMIGTRATLTVCAMFMAGAAVGAARLAAPAAPVRRAPPLSTALAVGVCAVEPAYGRGRAVFIVAIEGAALMGCEMSIARLIAPWLGAGQMVWALLIATVMASIALGAACAPAVHRLTVRAPALMLLFAAAGAVVVSVAGPLIMRGATRGIADADVSVVAGCLAGVLAVIALPMTAFGAVPPLVIARARARASERDRATGRRTGRLYAVSTLGAVAGTVMAVTVLIPAAGAARSLLVFAVVATTGAAIAGARRRWIAGVLVAAAAALVAQPAIVKAPPESSRLVAERDGRYQYAQVSRDTRGRYVLQLNEGWAVHSIHDPASPWVDGYWDALVAAPTLAHDDAVSDTSWGGRMLVIGDAAGTTRTMLRAVRPAVQTEGVELDPLVTRLGRRYFGLRGTVHAADGRPWLAQHARRWNVIYIDAYRQPYIPFQLVTRECFSLVRARLYRDGIAVLNVGITPTDSRVSRRIAGTLRAAGFTRVWRVRVAAYNELVVAARDSGVTSATLRQRLQRSDLRDAPGVRRQFDLVARHLHAAAPVRTGDVFTDDRAPVEFLVDSMILGAAR